MSLTYHIKKKTVIYWQLMAMLNLDYCRALVDHHQDCGPVIHAPVTGTNYPLTGMSTIYAVRDFLGGEEIWEQTVAGILPKYPHNVPEPAKWVVMGLMDSQLRTGDMPKSIKKLPPDLSPTVEDVANITAIFSHVLGKVEATNLIANPQFDGSFEVGGADANLIINNTLWDIRTTGRKYPLDLDCIIQQVGYYLLDFENKYELKSICWYYTRQQCLFEHPIEPLLTKGAKLRFQRMLKGA
jgi:hypothetical protein